MQTEELNFIEDNTLQIEKVEGRLLSPEDILEFQLNLTEDNTFQTLEFENQRVNLETIRYTQNNTY